MVDDSNRWQARGLVRPAARPIFGLDGCSRLSGAGSKILPRAMEEHGAMNGKRLQNIEQDGD
jgi:hypothetical protein